MFLVDCGKGIIRRSQVRVIFQMLLTIISERGLASTDSQDIIVSDPEMERFTEMPYLHLLQLKSIVMSMLTLEDHGRALTNPTDSYKHLISRLFPPQPQTGVTAIRQTEHVEVVLSERIRWKMERELSLLLIGFVHTEPLEFQFILSQMTLYISNNRDRLTNQKNLEVAYVRHDPLYEIFGVSYIHKSQIRGLVRDHVQPIVVSSP